MSATIFCDGCSDIHDVKEVKFLNVEENELGWDVLTFHCANSNFEGISSVRGDLAA
jgi:hypothetical protein